MAKLDYSFLEEAEPSEGALDYSFLDEASPYGTREDGTPKSDFGKLPERVLQTYKGGLAGAARFMAETKPDETLPQFGATLADKLGLEKGKEPSVFNVSPIQLATPIVDEIASMVTKGTFDLLDLDAAKGDPTKQPVRDAIRMEAPKIQAEARRILGSPEMQYQGTEGAPEWVKTGQKLGWEVAEAVTHMAPMLMVDYFAKTNGKFTLGAMWGEVAGHTYGEYMEKTGGDHDRSMAAGKYHAWAEVLPETLPVMAFLRPIKAGAATKRLLEGTFGEGAQEALTSILQQTYDSQELEGMSLKEAIQGIKWDQVRHDFLVGLGAGFTLSVPGTIADAMAKPDQEGSPPELFSPTHKAGGGQDVQVVTKDGKVVPDTYINEAGETLRDANAVPLKENADDVSLDINANVARIKKEIGYQDPLQGLVDEGIIGAEMRGPLAPTEAVEMPTGLPELESLPAPVEPTTEPTAEKPTAALIEAQTKPTFPKEPPGPPPVGEKVLIDHKGNEIQGSLVRENNERMVVRVQDPYLGGQRDIVINKATGKAESAIDPSNSELAKETYTLKKPTVPTGIIDQIAHEEKHTTEPVEPTGWARATAVEYQTKHPQFAGMILTHRPGDERFGHKAVHYYGDIAETVDADGMSKDVILNKDYNADSDSPIFVASQLDNKTREFRQNKILAGFETEQAAKKGFIEQFGDNFGGIKQISKAEFDKWKMEDGKVPYALPLKTPAEPTQAEQALKKAQKKPKPKTPAEQALQQPEVAKRTIEPQGPEVNINITSTGQDMKGRIAVVEGSQLIASNDDAGNPNPQYPTELQPRDRAKGSSMMQIQKMAADLRPELLTDNGKANGGAPIIGPDGVVESGNGRTMAILRAYREKQADGYREYLKQNAASYGLTEAQIDAMKNPVLVRVRDETMDMNERAEFARQANQSGVAPMTPTENAKADAQRITDEEMQTYNPSELGNVLATSNQSFLESFGKRLGDLAVGGLSTPDGRWTKQMADRVQAAVFYKAYENESLLALMAEEADPEIKNILSALNKAAPAFARARSGYEDLGDLDIIHDIVGAIDVIRQAKNEGTSVKQILDQAGLFGDVDPVVGAIAEFIEAGARSPKRLGIGFTEMANFLENELNNLSQESLFDLAPATKADIVAAANSRITEVYGQEKGIQDLFQVEDRPSDRASAPEPGAVSGEQAAVQGTEAATETGVTYEIPDSTRESDLSVREEQALQWDLFASPELPAETAKQQSADNFFTRYRQVETGTFNTTTDTVTSPGQVAHTIAQIRKHAQELFLAVVTDADGKILNVIRHSKGTIDGASVYPGVVVGAIANTPGSKNVWLAHNHPSGFADPSQADLRITGIIVNMMDGLDIDFKGHVIVAKDRYTYFKGDQYSGVGENEVGRPIPPGVRNKSVPVTERMLRKRNQNETPALERPTAVREYIDKLDSDAGILLLNNRHVPVGVVSISPAEMGKLRDGTRVRRILSAIDETNASAVITFSKNQKPKAGMAMPPEMKNLGNYLARLEVRHIDTFVGRQSMSELGVDMGNKDMPFFRRADPQESSTEYPMDKESRLDRAQDQGFDTGTIYYHATQARGKPEDFTSFEPTADRPFVFVSEDPSFADKFNEVPGFDTEYLDYSRIVPLYVRKGKNFDYANISAAKEKSLTDYLTQQYARENENYLSSAQKDFERWNASAKEGGFKFANLEHWLERNDADGLAWFVGENRETAATKYAKTQARSQVNLVKTGNWKVIEGYEDDMEMRGHEDRSVLGWMKNQGYESFYVEEFMPGAGRQRTLALMDPNQARSVNASFIPGEETSPDLLARKEDPYSGFDGKEISYQVEVEDTGKSYTVTVDAGTAMRDIDTRLEALRELRDCI